MKERKKIEWQEGGGVGQKFGGFCLAPVESSLEQFSQHFHWQALVEPLGLLIECIVLSFLWPKLPYYLGKRNCTFAEKRGD